MARQRPNCGTRAGYQYHLRHGENICGPCQQAKADHMQEYREKQRGMAGEDFEASLDSEPMPKLDELDPIAAALENLRQIRAALKSCQPAAVASLTKREQDLVAWLVKERDKGKAEGKSALDQLAEKRAKRMQAS